MLTKIFHKLIGLYVHMRFRKVPIELRYYCRDTYYCKYAQLKHFFRDYVFRKPYKELSFNGEFAPELQFALPHAYWHFLNGTLLSTTSSKFTRELYFFSRQHNEEYSSRTNEGNYNFEIPRVLYSHDYNMSKWAPVPLKKHYKNDIYVYDKPSLIIANRYNMEWEGPPISYFSIEMLEYLISSLKDTYQIIYNRPRPQNITTDNSDIYEMNEYDWIRGNHPEVIMMEDLWAENRINAYNFNHLQLSVYANAIAFLSIHGGTATLASYFEGKNLIYSKQGPEHYFKCYQKLYPKFSGASIFHAKTEEDIKEIVQREFLSAEAKKLVN